MLKLINDTKVSLDKYSISDNGLLHKVVREDDQFFHTLVVPVVSSKYVLHQVHNALGQMVLLELLSMS